MIYDCFTLFNDLDLLDIIELRELDLTKPTILLHVDLTA
jgi:hypothetical protein